MNQNDITLHEEYAPEGGIMKTTFNPDTVIKYDIGIRNRRYFDDDELAIYPRAHGEWVKSIDYSRAIMEQAAEYQGIIKGLEAKIQKLEALRIGEEIAVLQKKLEGYIEMQAKLAAARRCGSCDYWYSYTGECHNHASQNHHQGVYRDDTCDKWRPL